MTEQLNVQALEALTLANASRTARAKDKKLIARGDLAVSTVLVDPPRHWWSARVIDLLIVLPSIGRTKADHWLRMTQVNPQMPLERLTVRQRTTLARHVDVWVSRRGDMCRKEK